MKIILLILLKEINQNGRHIKLNWRRKIKSLPNEQMPRSTHWPFTTIYRLLLYSGELLDVNSVQNVSVTYQISKEPSIAEK